MPIILIGPFDRLVIVLGINDVEVDTRTIQRGFGEGPIVYGRIVDSLIVTQLCAEALEIFRGSGGPLLHGQ